MSDRDILELVGRAAACHFDGWKHIPGRLARPHHSRPPQVSGSRRKRRALRTVGSHRRLKTDLQPPQPPAPPTGQTTDFQPAIGDLAPRRR